MGESLEEIVKVNNGQTNNQGRGSKWVYSYLIATGASYALGALSSWYSRKSGCGPEVTAGLAFTVKTLTFYLTRIGSYTIFNWQDYKNGKSWRNDADNLILSSVHGTNATLAGLGLHWIMMKLPLLPNNALMSAVYFTTGNLIPGGLGALRTLSVDKKKGIL